jgi:Flp pilus assembly protein TadG
MRTSRKSRQKGNAMIEFVFVGIPMIFVLISIFEAARGMWVYTTLAHAVKEGARFAAVRGDGFRASCITAGACQLTVGQVASEIQNAGVGLIPTEVVNVTIGGNDCGDLAACAASGTALNLMTGTPITITAQYRFASALSMFWPGAGPGMIFNGGAPFLLPAQAQETVQF